MRKKILFVVNVDWFFVSHRLEIAKKALSEGYEVHLAAKLTPKGRQELENNGFILHELNLDRSNSSVFSSLFLLVDLFALYKRIRPDLVHLITIKPVLLGGIAARLAKIPAVVFAVSGMGFIFLARDFFASFRRFIIGNLYFLALGHNNSKVIFQNMQDLLEVTRLAKLKSDNVTLIFGSGVQLDEFVVKPKPSGSRIVMLPARMLKDKGVMEFVQAAKTLIEDINLCNENVRFVLVGEPDKDNQSSVSLYEIDEWVRMGYVEYWAHRIDMNIVLSLATIVVLPSYREGFPKVLMEAAACGRAIVTTDVPGCRDAIQPNITGLLVLKKDPASLASAIKFLLLNPSRCDEMGANGRLLAEANFDVNKVVRLHIDLYRSLLGK